MCIRDSFRYIAFGLWNGILITASLLMERRFLSWKEKLHINDKSTGWRIFMTVRTFGPVSYTHLDVYKRQSQSCP